MEKAQFVAWINVGGHYGQGLSTGAVSAATHLMPIDVVFPSGKASEQGGMLYALASFSLHEPAVTKSVPTSC